MTTLHDRLGHRKYIDSVPKFPNRDPVLDVFSTWIKAKQTKNAATGTTLKATVPFEGFSMDFSFAGIRSKNLKPRRITLEFMVDLACY